MTEYSDTNTHHHAWIWAVMLGFTTLSGTIVFACMMPFVAVATIAALSMPRRVGLAALTACWLGNQILGFGVLGYPWDFATFAAGLSLLAASLMAYALATLVADDMDGWKPFAAVALAFAAFELTLWSYAFVGGDLSMFTFEIVLLIGTNDLIWFIALWSAWQMLALFVPGWRNKPAQAPQ